MAQRDNRATTLALLLLAGVALTINIASSAPVGSEGAMGQGVETALSQETVAIVLYDQTDAASGNSAPDQDFETAYDTYDSEGADDFEVTFPESWNIDQVNTSGSGTGPVTDVTVRFYADNAGFPAAVPQPGCDFPDLTTFTGVAALSISLPTPCSLAPGRYWVAIQVEQDFLVAGQHYWANRTAQSFNESVWRNPGDGFGSGCTAWGRQRSCGVGGGVSPDFLFQILGDLATLIFGDGFETGTTTHWSFATT